MSRHIPVAGEFYKHFKGNVYQVVTLAKDADSLEKQVVYQALYGSYQTYVRPLEEFMSEVDRDKYPNASQEFRFEQVVFAEDNRSTYIVPVRTTITPLGDEQEMDAVDMENYQAIENQRKEIEGERRKNLGDRVSGAIEKQDEELQS